MPDWPEAMYLKPQRLAVPNFDEGLITPAAAFANGAVWTANLCVAVPFTLMRDMLITQISVVIITQNGNCDVAILDENGVRLRSMGATAMGVAGVQTFNITDLRLGPGRYYVAFASDSATAVITESASIFGATAVACQIIGVRQMAAAYPIPATVTFANPTRITMPAFVLDIGTDP
jgi:hypothetical protein